MAELEDRTVIVTGGSRGIGLEACRDLAANGARVVLAARGAEALERAADELPGDGHIAHAMDVADPGAWPELIDAAGELHGLVTAAAVLEPIGPTASVDANEVLDALRVNLMGTFLAIQHALPRLAEHDGGAIVTFSGGGATSPLPRYDAYAMSKAAVVRLTENVAADEARVRTNCVAPGFVATEIHHATLDAGDRAGAGYAERTREQLREGGSDIGRAAALVRFLLSDAAAGISGKLLSAPWDRWEDDAFRARLAAEPDLCTLRRIDDQAFGAIGRQGDGG